MRAWETESSSRWCLFLWASTMSWLLVAKILPPFLSGEPPKHGGAPSKPIPFAGKSSATDGQSALPFGKQCPAQATTEVLSRVLLQDIPLREMAPQWMSSVVDGLGYIRLDCRTRMALDSLGNLSFFETKVQLNDLPLVVKALGRVDRRRPRLDFCHRRRDA